MPRTYKRKTTQGNYGSQKLQQAVCAIRANEIRLPDAVIEYGVPRSTLVDHLSRRFSIGRGGQPIFTPQQENVLRDRIFYLAECGFPLTSGDVQSLVFRYGETLKGRKLLQKNMPKNWEDTKKASRDWFSASRQDTPK